MCWPFSTASNLFAWCSFDYRLFDGYNVIKGSWLTSYTFNIYTSSMEWNQKRIKINLYVINTFTKAFEALFIDLIWKKLSSWTGNNFKGGKMTHKFIPRKNSLKPFWSEMGIRSEGGLGAALECSSWVDAFVENIWDPVLGWSWMERMWNCGN